MVFHVLDDDELDFPFNGPTRFEGLELPEQLRCNPRALREGYLAALGDYLEEVRRGCSRHNVDYALLRTSQPLDAALAAYLTPRSEEHQRNLKLTRTCGIGTIDPEPLIDLCPCLPSSIQPCSGPWACRRSAWWRSPC